MENNVAVSIAINGPAILAKGTGMTKDGSMHTAAVVNGRLEYHSLTKDGDVIMVPFPIIGVTALAIGVDIGGKGVAILYASERQVWLSASTDQGVTWAPPCRVRGSLQAGKPPTLSCWYHKGKIKYAYIGEKGTIIINGNDTGVSAVNVAGAADMAIYETPNKHVADGFISDTHTLDSAVVRGEGQCPSVTTEYDVGYQWEGRVFVNDVECAPKGGGQDCLVTGNEETTFAIFESYDTLEGAKMSIRMGPIKHGVTVCRIDSMKLIYLPGCEGEALSVGGISLWGDKLCAVWSTPTSIEFRKWPV